VSYQALARKWRPKHFAEVIGQRGATQTLSNMLTSGRVAQAFVFGGPRGVGKTTTARILARALNCVHGPTAEPCGVCEECVEIAEGRHIDVFEMDAATHTGIDNIREVIIEGLAIRPARARYKVFVIDEVHQLSASSFNALLKSVEEPPPHVVFIMATTELGKIPDTILSRAQVFEFRTIGTRAIVEQLRTIAHAEGIVVDEAALGVIARFAEGSLRDAESAFDQVIAFAGGAIGVEDVTTTLGLVGRDLLLDMLEAVADEHGAALFELAGRAAEAGNDPRQVCRELSKVVRDLVVLSVDPTRADDPDIAPETDRERLTALADRFSREDLLRAFDLLARAELEIRSSAEPRYHLEMTLLRWVQLRKLVPLSDLIDDLRKGAVPGAGRERFGTRPAGSEARGNAPARRPASVAAPVSAPPLQRDPQAPTARQPAAAPVPPSPAGGPMPSQPSTAQDAPPAGSALKEALLAEIRAQKKVLYNTVIAAAQKIDVEDDRVTLTFGQAQNGLRKQFEPTRAWVESIASRLAGHRVSVVTELAAGPAEEAPPNPEAAAEEQRKKDLRAEAMQNVGVQAMLDVFQAEIRDVEEI
jgi:DNA polymerase-3 subunit gamma/tau